LRIVLLRHGRPKLPTFAKLSARDFSQWIDAYNLAPLDQSLPPPQSAFAITQSCSTVVCSHLHRSTDSAHTLGKTNIDYIDPLFREVDLPYAQIAWPKLSANFWLVCFRILWLLGYAPHCESLVTAKKRAVIGADRLQQLAEQKGSIIFVGHGFINKFIAQALLTKGWQGQSSNKFNSRYWQFSVYELPIK
jgi:broad specificity phosphatase PhoE